MVPGLIIFSYISDEDLCIIIYDCKNHLLWGKILTLFLSPPESIIKLIRADPSLSKSALFQFMGMFDSRRKTDFFDPLTQT